MSENPIRPLDDNVNGKRVRIHYNLGRDIIFLIGSSGLWLVWMIMRPKYKTEYTEKSD